MLVVDDVILAKLDRVVVVDSYIRQACLFLDVVEAVYTSAFAFKDVPALPRKDPLNVPLEEKLLSENVVLELYSFPEVQRIVELHCTCCAI